MVIYNAATRELTAKIVYYGPGLGGKTTNLQLLHERLEPATVGKLLNLATQTDRTIYFDLLPVELGDIKGYKIRFQLATVPGQTAFNETRRVVLKGTDGIVFVADSQWSMLPKNLESWQNLKENLKANGVSFEGIPIVVQYNKRDLSDILSIDALQEALGLSSYPFVEAVASAGRGVTETFKLISKLTFVDLLRRLQGRRPEEAGAPPPRREPDDLLSWKDSLLNRAAAAGAAPGAPPAGSVSESPAAKRPFALVPSLPDEAPFETGEEPADFASEELEAGSPFGSAVGPGEAAESGLEGLSLPPMPEIERSSGETAPRFLGADEPAEASQEQHTSPIPRVTDAPGQARPEEAVLSATPTEEPEEASVGGTGDAGAEPPAASPGVPPAAWALSEEVDIRIRTLEQRLQEAIDALGAEREERVRASDSSSALSARLEAFERDSRSLGKSLAEKHQSVSDRVESVSSAAVSQQQELDTRVTEIQERLAADEKRQRTSEDDVAMALRSLGERGEKLSQQIATLSQQLESVTGQVELLESALREKTNQSRREADDIRGELQALHAAVDERIGHGRREAEDIRSQIAPLLEAHAERGSSDERLSQEFDRLRESLAESLGDLSERLRRAVRGL